MSRAALISIALVCALLGFAVFVAIRPTTVFGLNGTAVSTSVERVINSHSAEPDVSVVECSSKGSGEWACTADRDPGSNALSYVNVRSGEDGCWTGERLLAQVFGKSHRSADDLHGCVRLWDYSGIAL